MTATGAFLLLAAAAVFVAVQWEHLGEEVKLAILGALTGGFLLAGRRLRRVIPATGGVLFHLGALLIPFNTAAIAIDASVSWGQFLLIEGATAAVAWFLLDRLERSPVLRWSAGGAFVVAAAGASSVLGLPTPLVLAGAAVVAQRLRAPKPALGWAMVAGLGPVLVFAEPWITRFEVVDALGLAPDAPGPVWALSGALAAAVIGIEAHRRRDAVLVIPAATSLVIGIAATWSTIDPSGEVDLVGAAAVFLALELVAGLVRRDPFWDGPARVAAGATEVARGPRHAGRARDDRVVVRRRATPGSRRSPSPPSSRPRRGWSATCAASPANPRPAAPVGPSPWAAGGGRRRAASSPARWSPTALLSGSSLAVGTAMVVLAAALVVTGRPGGHAVAAALAILAPLLASFDLVTTARYQHHELLASSDLLRTAADQLPILALGLAGALVLAAAAVVRAHLADAADNGPVAWFLATAALGPIAMATFVLADHTSDLALLLVAGAMAWAVALVLDRAGRGDRGIVSLGCVGRFGALLVLLGAGLVGTRGTMVLAGVLAVAYVLDALRTRSELPLLGLAVALPVLVGATAADLGLTPAETGLALTMLAAVSAGAHLLLGERGWPILGVLVSSGAAGFGLAATEPTTGWLAVLVLAGIGLAYSTVHRSVVGAGISAGAATVAVWGLLVEGGIEALDAYVAPVAVVLTIAGVLARRSSRVTSWVAFAPAIVLLGGSALVERIDGGGGVHALVAAAVGIAAVIAGGVAAPGRSPAPRDGAARRP